MKYAPLADTPGSVDVRVRGSSSTLGQMSAGDVVTVTGSLIPQIQQETASPVVAITGTPASPRLERADGVEVTGRTFEHALRMVQFDERLELGHLLQADDDIVAADLNGGFALVAWPAEYGESGIMTFIVNQEGQVFEKNLGPDTAKKVARLHSFDPGASWRKVDNP